MTKRMGSTARAGKIRRRERMIRRGKKRRIARRESAESHGRGHEVERVEIPDQDQKIVAGLEARDVGTRRRNHGMLTEEVRRKERKVFRGRPRVTRTAKVRLQNQV